MDADEMRTLGAYAPDVLASRMARTPHVTDEIGPTLAGYAADIVALRRANHER